MNSSKIKDNDNSETAKRRVSLLSLQGNSNIGLYIAANDKHAFCGVHLSREIGRIIEDVLGCEVINITIAGIQYPGIFMLFDDNRIIVPQIIFENEKKKLEKAGYEVIIIDTRHTALRNSIMLHNKKALISEEVDKSTQKQLENLGIEVKRITVSEFESVGNLISASENEGFASIAFNDGQIKELKKFFGISLSSGTLSNRNLYISSSLVVNKNGMIISSDSMPDEVMDITAAFDA